MARQGIITSALLAAALVAACSDDPKKLPIGGVCADSSECESGLCATGVCLDPSLDEDGDGLVNGLEVGLGSDPQRADTDADGLPDGEELEALANVDTDADGKADVLESAVADADGDCVTDQYDADDAAPTTDTSPMIPVLCRTVGVCAAGGLAVSCASGAPACVYTGVTGYADPEAACDGADDDCDGVADDGFPDRDEDGARDCVDVDWDNDGVADASDVCPEVADPSQADADGNGIGDACADAYGWTFDLVPEEVAVGAAFEVSGRLVRLAAGEGPAPPTFEGAATLGSEPTLVARALDVVDNAWSLDDLIIDAVGRYRLEVSAPGTVTGASDLVDVVHGPLCRLVVTAPATVVAGAPFDVAVTARDAGGFDRTTRPGAATFELGCTGAVPTPGTATFIGGVATMRGIVATAAGPCDVTVRVDDVVVEPCAGEVTHALTVSPTSADRFELVGMPASVVADAPVTLGLRVLDGFGNVATGYRGTVTFASDDARAALPAPVVLDEAASGEAEVEVRLRTAGAREVSAGDTGGLVARASTVVGPAPAARLALDAPAEVAAGAPFGIGVTAYDAFDNVATGFAGPITLSSDDALATLPTDVVAASGVASASGLVLRTTGPVTLGARDASGAVEGERVITVTPGADRRLVIESPPTAVEAGAPFDLAVRIEDAFGNLDPDWDGLVAVVVADPAATLPDPIAVAAGRATLEGVVMPTAGTWLVTVRDAVQTAIGASFSLRVDPGPFAALDVSCTPDEVAAGQTSACAVRAEDALGNLTPGVAGVMDVSVSDPAAVAPASVTLVAGLGALDVAPRTVGTATVEVRSATAPVIVGSDTIAVLPAAVSRFALVLAADTKAGAPTTFTLEARDAFDNRVTGFVGVVPLTTSDARATLATSVVLADEDAGRVVVPVTFGTAGAQSVTAHAGDPRVGSATTTVRAGTPTRLRLDGSEAATAGVASGFTVTIEDAFGNTADDPDDVYTGVVTFSVAAPGPDLDPDLPAATTFLPADLGVRALEATWYRAGTWTLEASGAGLEQGDDTLAVTVAPAGLDHLVASGPTTVDAGATFGLEARGEDAWDNAVAGATGLVIAVPSGCAGPTAATVPPSAIAGLSCTLAGARTFTLAAGVVTAEVVVDVRPTAPATLEVELPATAKAGVPATATARVRDAHGNVATAFAGALVITTDDPQATAPGSVQASAGVATFEIVFGSIGERRVTATLGAIDGQDTTTVRAGAPHRLALSAGAGDAIAGEAAPFVVTIFDAYDNVADDAGAPYLGTVSFTVVGGAPSPAPDLPSPITFVAGDAGNKGAAATWYDAGSWTLRATGTALTLPTADLVVAVGPGPAAELVLTGPDATPPGVGFDVFARLDDAWGNTLTAPTSLTIDVPSGCTGPAQATVPPQTVSGFACTEAGPKTFTFTAGALSEQLALDVDPSAPASVELILPAEAKAGVAVTATARARDTFGNVASGYVGAIGLVSNDSKATLPSSVTAVAGEATFEVTFGSVGPRTVTASIGTFQDTEGALVRAGAPRRIALTDVGGSVTAGVARDVTITILDAYDNRADDPDDLYAGTVTLAVVAPGPDLAPTLPGPITFVAGDAGRRAAPVTWLRAGLWTLRATGTALAEPSDDLDVTVVPGPADHLHATGPATVDAGASFAVDVEVRDAWENVRVGSASVAITYPSGCTGPSGGTVPPKTISGLSCTQAGTRRLTFAAGAGGALTDDLDVTVTPLAPASVELVLPGTAKAGVAVTATARARDTHGNVATGYGGAIGIGSGDTKATLPSSVTASAGVATFDVTFGSVGAQSVTATLGAFTDTESATVRAGAPHELVLTDAGGTATAGTGKGFTLTVVDAYDNRANDPADTYLGTVTLSVVAPGPDPAPTLPSPITFVAGDASQRTSSATWFRAGTWTLRATGTALAIASDDLDVTVIPGAAHHLQVTGPTTVAAAESFAVDVEVRDAWENVRTASASVAITYPSGCTGPSPATVPPKTIGGLSCTLAGDKRLTFSTGAGGALTEDLDVTVTPLAPASVELVLPGTAKAGVPVTATVRARDAHGNVATGYGGPIGLGSGDTKATLPSSVTASEGEATFEVTFGSVGAQSVTATLGAFTDTESATVRAGAPHELVLTDAGGTATAGTGKGFTLTIVDAYDNRADDPADRYLGTVTLSVVAPGPDVPPTLPSPITFVAGDASQRTSSATWFRAGAWTLRATGTALAVATDDLDVTVVPGAADHLSVTGPSTVAAAETFSVDVEVRDAWENVRTASASVSITYPSGCTGPSGGTVPPKTIGGLACTQAGDKRLTFSTGTAGALSEDLDVTVTPLGAASVELVLPGTAKAGVAVMATVRARDAEGNVATGYNGAIGLGSGDTKATLPSSVTASAGEATFEVTFGSVGAQSVTATLGASMDTESATVRAGAPHKLVLTDAGGTATAGTGKGFTLTIVDAYDNRADDPADRYLGTVTLSVVAPGPDLPPTLPSPITFVAADASQRTASATWFRAGTWTLRGTGTALTLTTDDLDVTVTPGGADHLHVTGPSTVAAAEGFAVDVEVRDPWENVRTASASVSITYPSGCTGPSGATVPPRTISGLSCTLAGTRRLTFAAGALTEDLDVAVTPLDPADVELVLPGTAKAGVAVSATVRALDEHGNVATGFVGTIDLTTDDTKATLPSSVTATAGEATFDVTFGSVGSQPVTVTLGAFDHTESATVRAGAPHALVLTDAGGTATAGTGKGFTLTIVDAYDNRADDPADRYLGTVTLSVVAPGPDLTPTLPGPITFVAADASQRTASATWFRAGTWTLRGTGTALTLTTDDLDVTVTPGGADHLHVTGPSTVAAAETFSVDVEVRDAWENVRAASASVSITYPSGCTGPSGATVPPKTISGLSCTLAGTRRLTFAAGALTEDLDVAVTPLDPADVELVLPETAKAGVAVSATVRALDEHGNVATGFAGAIDLTTDDTKATLPSSVTATAGEATFDVTFGSVGSQPVTATLGAFDDTESADVRAGAPHRLVVTDAGGEATAGVAKGFTLTIVDAYDNLADDPADLYLGTVTPSVVAPGPDLPPSLPSPITFTADDVSQRAANATWYREGAWTLRCTGTSLTDATDDLDVTVVPAGPDHLNVTGPGTVGAGTPFALTVALVDPWDNPLTLSGGVAVGIPDGCEGESEVFVPPTTIEGFVCGEVGIKTFDMNFEGYLGDLDVEVVPGAPARLRWLDYPLAGEVAVPLRSFGQPLVVEVQDAAGNRVPTDVSVAVALAYNHGRGRLTGAAIVDAVDGLATFDALAIDRPGRYALAASSGALEPTPDPAVFDVLHAPPMFVGAPEVTVEGGCVTASVGIAQALSAPVDLELAFRWTDAVSGDVTRVPASTARKSPSGLHGLATSPDGVFHDVVWDASADVPRDGLAQQYAALELEIVARAGDASKTTIVPVAYDPSAKPEAKEVGSPADVGWSKVPPILWDFDGDGTLDLARWSADPILEGAYVGFVLDVGGAQHEDGMNLYQGPDVDHVGRMKTDDPDYDALWYVPAGAPEVRVQPYRRVGPFDIEPADGGEQTFYVCGEGVGVSVNDVVTADFDGDGSDELAIACRGGSDDLRILDTNPDGFNAWLDIGFEPTALAVVDWQHDGVPDLVAAGGTRVAALVQRFGELEVLEIRDLGGSTPITDLVAFDGEPEQVLTPRDGIEDLMIAHGTTTLTWLSSNPVYGSTLETVFGNERLVDVNEPIDRLAAADLDVDGRDDLLGVVVDGGPVTVLRSVRQGGPFVEEVLDASLVGSRGFALGDTDHDGRPEVAVATASFASVIDFVVPPLCRPDVAGAEPTPDPRSDSGNDFVSGHAWVDVDGDGWKDNVQVMTNSDFVTTLVQAPGEGRGHFGAFVPVGPALPQAPVLGDFDGDGLLDGAWADDTNVGASLQQPDGSFIDATIIPGTTCCGGDFDEDLVASDLDGDGLDDILIATTQVVLWYQNLGGLAFAEGVEIARWDDHPTPSLPDFHLRDLNHDGAYEVTASIYDEGADVFWLCWWLSTQAGWPTDPAQCMSAANAADMSIAVDASITPERPAILVMIPDLDFEETRVDFYELPSGDPISLTLPGIHGLLSTFTMRHADLPGEHAYTLTLDGNGALSLLGDVAASPDYTFETLTDLVGSFEVDQPEVVDVDGDGVVDLADDASIISGRALAPSPEIPALERGVTFDVGLLFGLNQATMVADLDGNGYLDFARLSFGSFGEGGQGDATFTVHWTDNPDALRRTDLFVAKPVGFFGTSRAVPARMPMPGLALGFSDSLYTYQPAPEGIAYAWERHDFGRIVTGLAAVDLDGDGLDELIGTVDTDDETTYGDVFVRQQTEAAEFDPPRFGSTELAGVYPDAIATGHLLEPDQTWLPLHIAAAVRDAELGPAIHVYGVKRGFTDVELGAVITLPPAEFEDGVRGLAVVDLDGDRRDDVVVGVRLLVGEGNLVTPGLRFFLQQSPGVFAPAGGVTFAGTYGETLLGLADLDRDGRVDLVTDEAMRWGEHTPGSVEFGALERSTGAIWLTEWPWRGRPALLGWDRWLPVPDGAGPPGYGP